MPCQDKMSENGTQNMFKEKQTKKKVELMFLEVEFFAER